MPDRLRTTEEVAEYLQVPVNTLYRWRGAQQGPRAVRVGKHLRWRQVDVESWLERQTTSCGGVMGPPGTTRAAGARRNHVGGKDGAVGAALISEMVNRARRAPELVDFSTNKLSRIIRAYVAANTYERDLVSWVISYADPTGEDAVRAVMRQAAASRLDGGAAA